MWSPVVPDLSAKAAVAMTLILSLSGVDATVGEKLESVAQAASGVATKAERAVTHGLKVAASGVERGAKAAGGVATRGAQKLGVPGAGASSAKR